MDGCDDKKELFFIGATNRPGILDEAVIRPGRLDQLIYIPLPDEPSRLDCFKAVMKKTPIAANVSFQFLAQLTDGYSGADITELCQRAQKEAIKASVNFEREAKAARVAGGEDEDMEGYEDPIKFLTREHFETAFQAARKSVSQADLQKFEDFKIKQDPMAQAKAAGKDGKAIIEWGEDENAIADAGNDDDMYD